EKDPGQAGGHTGRGAGQLRVHLPTYPSQHQRFWLTPPAGHGDADQLGQQAITHPLLAAVVSLAGGVGTVFTGQVSLHRHPWLADHAVGDQILLPGTALLELALHAGRHTGHPYLDELTLHTPLVIPAGLTLALQLTLTTTDPARQTLS